MTASEDGLKRSWLAQNWANVALVGALIVAGAVAYLLFLRPSSPTYTVNVTFLLRTNQGNVEVGRPCAGTGGYSDINAGAPLTVKDSGGKTLASGLLGQGHLIPRTDNAGGNCFFETSIAVPESSRYSFEVSRRGALAYSLEQLRTQGFTVDFVMGQ